MYKLLAILFVFTSAVVNAQERLTLDDAITRTLQNNFDVRISGLAAQQAKRNNTMGNAGMSPSVSLNGGLTGSSYNTHNELVNNTVQDNAAANTMNVNGAVNLSWTLFDGGRMFIIKKQLNQLDIIAQEQLKVQMQTMVSRVVQVYAQAVLLQRQLVAIDTALALANARMYISKVKYENGSSAKTDYLQARVDYNARRTDSLMQQAAVAQSFDTLNVLMGAAGFKTYVVDDSLQLNTSLEPVDKDRLSDINLSISIAKRNAEVSKLNVGVARSYMLPNLGVNGAYYYSKTESATGFAFFSRSYGPNGAANISIPLFQGGNLRRQVKVASLQSMRDELVYEKLTSSLSSRYRTAWNNYTVSVASYRMQQDNIGYAKENLDVQLARFRVGLANTLELRQAENDYVAALVAYYTSAYNLKVNETIVLELENRLVK